MTKMSLYKRLLLRLLFLILLFLILFFAAPLFFSLFAPFILAFIMAAILNPLVSFLEKKLHVSRRIISFAAVLLVFSSLATLIAWFIYTLVGETISLAKNIQILLDYFTLSYEIISVRLEGLIGNLPGDTEATLTGILNSVFEWVQSASRGLADYILTNTKNITVRVGNVVLSTIMFILSAYFITVDYAHIGAYFKKFRGSGVYNQLVMLKNTSKSAFGGYLKAQLLLALIAFVIMFVALTIYGQEYSFLIAIALSFIDFLPFLGTAVILVPWAILCLIGGDLVKALFLVILSFSYFIVRRLVEPKIMSSQTGLTPLIALLSTYIGTKLAGVIGLILGPIITVVILSIIKAGVFDNTKKDIKDLFNDLAKILRREE